MRHRQTTQFSSKNLRSAIHGFTIVELLVVIAVLGILVSLAVVSYGAWKKSTLETAVKNDLIQASNAMEAARNFDDVYPSTVPSSFSATDGVTITGGSSSGAKYCLEGTSVEDSSITFYIFSGTKDEGPKAGTCDDLPFIPPSGVVATYAGTGVAGFTDGPKASAQFRGPYGMAFGSDGTLYIADVLNHRIRKITPDGTVSTHAGSGTAGFVNGSAASAQFNQPNNIAVGPDQSLYVTELANHTVRKILPNGTVSTLAGNGSPGYAEGVGTSAQLYSPVGIAVDDAGVVYVSELGNSRIRKILPNGTTSTYAGSGTAGYLDGSAASAQFYYPAGLVRKDDGTLYVLEYLNYRIREITPGGTVSTVAGTGVSGFVDGPGLEAQLSPAQGNIVIDPSGNLYWADMSNDAIRMLSTNGMVTTLAGNGANGYADGVGAAAQFSNPAGLALSADGKLYIGDVSNNRIRVLE